MNCFRAPLKKCNIWTKQKTRPRRSAQLQLLCNEGWRRQRQRRQLKSELFRHKNHRHIIKFLPSILTPLTFLLSIMDSASPPNPAAATLAPRIASLKPRHTPSLNIFNPPPVQQIITTAPAFDTLGYDQSPKPVEAAVATPPSPRISVPAASAGGQGYYERTAKAIAMAMPSAAPVNNSSSCTTGVPATVSRPVIVTSMPAPSL